MSNSAPMAAPAMIPAFDCGCGLTSMSQVDLLVTVCATKTSSLAPQKLSGGSSQNLVSLVSSSSFVTLTRIFSVGYVLVTIISYQEEELRSTEQWQKQSFSISDWDSCLRIIFNLLKQQQILGHNQEGSFYRRRRDRSTICNNRSTLGLGLQHCCYPPCIALKI